jgi:hypothetical protein
MRVVLSLLPLRASLPTIGFADAFRDPFPAGFMSWPPVLVSWQKNRLR